MRCYIAGPMSGIPGFNFPAFDEARDKLRGDGWDVVSPADLDRSLGYTWEGATGDEVLTDEMRATFARNDIRALLWVDTVFVLPGWEDSTGARNEVRIAGWLGLPVYEYATREPVTATDPWSQGGKPNARAELLRTAETLVNGDRNAQYGDPRQDFRRTAAYWNTHLTGVFERKLAHAGIEVDHSSLYYIIATLVDPADVAIMMDLLKTSRLAWSPEKFDTWADKAGYTACGWDCARAD